MGGLEIEMPYVEVMQNLSAIGQDGDETPVRIPLSKIEEGEEGKNSEYLQP